MGSPSLTIVILVAAIVSLLAACNSDDSGSSADRDAAVDPVCDRGGFCCCGGFGAGQSFEVTCNADAKPTCARGTLYAGDMCRCPMSPCMDGPYACDAAVVVDTGKPGDTTDDGVSDDASGDAADGTDMGDSEVRDD